MTWKNDMKKKNSGFERDSNPRRLRYRCNALPTKLSKPHESGRVWVPTFMFSGRNTRMNSTDGNRCPTVAIKWGKNEICECSHDTTGKMTWKNSRLWTDPDVHTIELLGCWCTMEAHQHGSCLFKVFISSKVFISTLSVEIPAHASCLSVP